MKKSIESVEIESLEVPQLGRVTKGLRVHHQYFGVGTVVALFKFVQTGEHSIGVQFESAAGYKVLHPQHAKLRPLGYMPNGMPGSGGHRT